MGSLVLLRNVFDAPAPRLLAERTRGMPTRAIACVTLAAIYEGGSWGDAARIGIVGLQTVRDWVLRFNADGPAGLIDRKGAGLVLPFYNSAAITLHLEEILGTVVPDTHVVLVMDQSGAQSSRCLTTSPSSPCRHARPSSIRSSISGSSCATIDCLTASSPPMTISSTTAAMLGTTSSTNYGKSCPLDTAVGLIGSDQ